MSPAPLPLDESERLAALQRLGILDTAPEERYDRLVRLAAASLQTPIALISIVDEERQWFKARFGLDAPETPRDLAFCAHAIAEVGAEPFVVGDAAVDVRFADNPLVTGEPNIRFYAGQVVRDPDGHAMGTVCAIDRTPREFNEEQIQILRDLASLVESEFAHRKVETLVTTLDASERSKAALLDTLTEGLVVQDADGQVIEWNAAALNLLGLTADEISGRSPIDALFRTVYPDGSRWPAEDHPGARSLRTGEAVSDRTMGVSRRDGSLIWLRVSSRPIVDRLGRIDRVLTVFGNIAAEFDASQAAETVALRLRQAVDSSGIGTALLDDAGSTTYVNEAFATIVGLTHDRLLGRPPSAWIHPDDPMFRDGPCGFDVLDGANVTREIRVAEHDGAATWVRAHIARLADADEGDRFIMQLEDVTERRQLEATLQQSERIAHASLDSLEQGVIVADGTGFIEQINTAATRILGYSAAELTTALRSDSWTTYDELGAVLPLEQRPIHQVLVTNQPVHGAIIGWRRRDGRLVLIRTSCVPVTDESRTGRRFVVAFTDVTEQHRQKRLLDATFATAPVGLAVIDADEAVFRCNPAFASHTGVSSDDVEGLMITDLLGDDLYASPTDGGQTASGEERMITRPDGSEVWLETRAAHIDDLDRALDIIATFDVTERKHLELDLERFGHLFRNANDIITIVDETGQVLYASPSNEQILGYPDGWRSPGGVLDLVHPEDLGAAAERFAELVNGERGNEPFTMRLRAAGGEWKAIETIGTNLLDEPSVKGIVLTSRDVTERHLLSRELAYRASHDALTDLPNRATVEERLTNALARARRQQASVGLLFLDLDKFKSVNDTLGHAAGDAALIEVARRLSRAIRDSDVAARLGGDEFVVVLDLVDDIEHAAQAARRIHEELSIPPTVIGDMTVTVSMGVAVSQHDDTASALLSRADAALYRAKAQGSSRISVCSATALNSPD